MMQKNRHLGTIAQLCWAVSSQLRQSEKNLLSSDTSTCRHNMVNFGPLTAEIGSGVWSKFQLVSLIGFVAAPTSLNGGQPNFARCLAVSWAGICISWGFCPL